MQNHNIGNDTSASFRNATSTGRRTLNAADARSVIRTRATIRTAFTLIELLVVIAIIAILAGMLMPALNQAREKGVGASCIGRLKSIGQADALYQNDFGYISPAREYLAGSRGLYWCGDTSSSGGGSGDSIDFTAEGYLTPYIRRATGSNDIGSELSSNAFICPSGVVQGMLTGQKVTAANGGGYGVNRNVHGTLFMASPSIIVYPGTFDPLTLGHLDLLERVSGLFDQVVLAIAANSWKPGALFTCAERIEMAREVVRELPNVKVEAMKGMLVDFCHERGIRVVLRGLRAYSDFEYEFQFAAANSFVDPNIDMVFFMAGSKTSFISSSTINELHKNGADITPLVPSSVIEAYRKKDQSK